MKHLRSLALIAAPLAIASCATSPPAVYGPSGPVAASTSSTPLPGQIAECGHAGAPLAQVIFPAGWQERLGQVAQTSQSNDELLGGPVTTEVVDRDAQPIRLPSPVYPAPAASAGREAQCYAMFDVNKTGTPEEILTACSSADFNASTLSAVSTLIFEQKLVDGRPVRRLNVVYPLLYCLG